MPDTPLTDLRNIGPTIARRLCEVDIRTERDLRALGAAEAFRRIWKKRPGRRPPVCYFLYSLEGALRDVHWNDLPQDVKSRLRKAAGVES